MATTNGSEARPRVLREIGVTGLPAMGGVIYDEWLPALKGARKHVAYREMSEQEPIVVASLLTYEMLMRNASRDVKPANATPEGLSYAEWLRGALYQDMSHSFPAFMSEAGSMLTWGWSYHEDVLKIRGGDVTDPARKSRFSDHKYGWRKWPIRAQETLDRWEFDEGGGVQAMIQRDPNTGALTEPIPIGSSLLFRMRQHKGSPEGVSLLRGVYKPWYHKKHVEIIQNIGISRSLAGIPKIGVPPSLLSLKATAEEVALRQTLQQLLSGLERDQVKGFLFPELTDPSTGKELYTFKLISPEGDRASTLNTQDVIKQYNLEMLMAMMTAVLIIGHEAQGSFALHSSATQLLTYGLNAILDSYYEVINSFAIPRLWALNDFPREHMPEATHGDVESVPLDESGTFVLRLAQSGLDVHGLEAQIMRRAGFKPHEAEPEAAPRLRVEGVPEGVSGGTHPPGGVEMPHEATI